MARTDDKIGIQYFNPPGGVYRVDRAQVHRDAGGVAGGPADGGAGAGGGKRQGSALAALAAGLVSRRRKGWIVAEISAA